MIVKTSVCSIPLIFNTAVVKLHICYLNANLFLYVAEKMRHVEDDSTIMWAIGPDCGVIAKHAKFCGEEVEMLVPFEGANSAEVQYLPICQAFFAL